MNGIIIERNEDKVKDHLGKFVKDTVEESLNGMPKAIPSHTFPSAISAVIKSSRIK